jgi:hypothetical protein
MSTVSAAIRRHHQKLVSTLAEQVTALVESRPEVDPEALVAFLKGDLLPHARGEEQHLYPLIEPLIKAHSLGDKEAMGEGVADEPRQDGAPTLLSVPCAPTTGHMSF